jgi:hypothetical protein
MHALAGPACWWWWVWRDAQTHWKIASEGADVQWSTHLQILELIFYPSIHTWFDANSINRCFPAVLFKLPVPNKKEQKIFFEDIFRGWSDKLIDFLLRMGRGRWSQRGLRSHSHDSLCNHGHICWLDAKWHNIQHKEYSREQDEENMLSASRHQRTFHMTCCEVIKGIPPKKNYAHPCPNLMTPNVFEFWNETMAPSHPFALFTFNPPPALFFRCWPPPLSIQHELCNLLMTLQTGRVLGLNTNLTQHLPCTYLRISRPLCAIFVLWCRTYHN